jgi:UDP-N-acetylmuramoyl-L-alanyl-D-glutamate--2,6-diaminopimelate ligase
VTEEDDRDEDGLAILHEIGDGARKAGKTLDRDLYLIHDRSQAIKAAIDNASAGDTVLLLGKGHEKSILANQGKKAWDEAGEARKSLRLLKQKT